MAIADDALALDRPAREALSLIRARLYESPPGPDDWAALADSPYAAFARRSLSAAASRGAAIQAGTLPYAADQAFTAEEVAVLGRCARVALSRDEPWLPELLDRLLPAVAVAPTAARTLPSQALLFELARAAQEFPTPEAAAALRTVRGVIRHRGVPKQLDRNIKRIDAALADRPETAFRQPGLGFGPDGVHRVDVGAYSAQVTVGSEVSLTWRRGGGPELRGVPAAVRRDHPGELAALRDLVRRTRAHVATLVRALEGGLISSTSYAYARWLEDFATHPAGRPVASRLIWEAEVAPGRWRTGLFVDGALVSLSGRPVAGEAVRLWHPVRSQPPRSAPGGTCSPTARSGSPSGRRSGRSTS